MHMRSTFPLVMRTFPTCQADLGIAQMDATSNLSYTYDDQSNVWLEPLSVMINCMLPVEYIYTEWFRWSVPDEVLRLEPEYLLVSRKPKDVETGSRAEGFCIPEFRVFKNSDHFPEYEDVDLVGTEHWISDNDYMEQKEAIDKARDNHPVTIFNEVVHCPDNPIYLKLKITEDWKKLFPAFKDATYLHQCYLFPANGTHHFLNVVEQNIDAEPTTWTNDAHGPVRKLESNINWMVKYEEDRTCVFKYPEAWPEPAMEWLVRPRSGCWPSPDLIQEIVESGCHIAPVGRGKRQHDPRPLLDYLRDPTKLADSKTTLDTGDQAAGAASDGQDCACGSNASLNSNHDPRRTMDETEWRLSFSVAENRLAQSVTPVQRRIMVLLKMIKKMYFPDISTYLLKNLMFWEIEKQDESFWSEENSAKCLLHMLNVLEKTLGEGILPHYIMPESNLLSEEDPNKLAKAVVSIRELRSDILTNVLTMLQRCCSLWLNSIKYHEQLYFQPFLTKLQEETLSSGEVQEMILSLLSLFISQCKACIESMQRQNNKSNSDDAKRSACIIINVYESLLGRCLAKLWLLQNPESSPEEFTTFVKQKSPTFHPSNSLVEMALEYFQQGTKGKSLIELVPTNQAMENIKEVYTIEQNIFLNKNRDVFQHLYDSLSAEVLSSEFSSIEDILDAFRTLVEQMSIDKQVKPF